MARTKIDVSLIKPISNGSAATDLAAFGQLKVIQITTGTSTSNFSSTSTSFVTTNLSATITPTSASNKILILATAGIESGSGNNECFVTIARGGSNILSSNGGHRFFSTAQLEGSSSLCYVDSPASTSALTYAIQIKTSGSNMIYGDGTQFMILMEVVA